MKSLVFVLLLDVSSALPVRTVVLAPSAARRPIKIQCPVGAETRIVLPEPLVVLKASPGAGTALHVEAEQARPLGVLSVRPLRAATGTLEARGTTLLLTLVVEAVPWGGGSEIRLSLARPEGAAAPLAGPASPPPTGAPGEALPIPARPAPFFVGHPSEAGTPDQSPDPALPSSEPPGSPLPPKAPVERRLDLAGILHASPETIGRWEEQGGRKCVFVDLWKEDRPEGRLWLRFRLERGISALEQITRDGQPIRDVHEERVDGDLWVVAQLQKAEVTRETRITLDFEDLPRFTFQVPRIR